MKKATICVLSALAGVLAGGGAVGKEVGERANKFQMMSEKHLSLYLMMNHWVRIKQEGKKLSEYFEKNNYKNIAIYGMSYAGETLLDELKGTDITVAYGIDKNADSIYSDVDIVSGDDVFEPVDVVVVTAITFFDEIEQNLSGKVSCPIISLEDVLYGI